MRGALLLLCLAFSPALLAQTNFSPFVATREEIAQRMIHLAALKKGDVVVDLGSGDGRLVIWSAKSNPGITGYGVDIDAKLVREATARAWMEDVGDRVKFHHRNVFDADLRRVDVIYLWLFPELMRLLRNKIFLEARPGTRIVTQMFGFGPWLADATDTEQRTVQLWIVPAKIAGNWSWELAVPGSKRNRYDAIFDQVFQQADGVVRVRNTHRAIREFKLTGDRLAFSLTIPLPRLAQPKEHEFRGIVKGDRIEGSVRLFERPPRGEDDEPPSIEVPWRATRGAKSRYFDPVGAERPR